MALGLRRGELLALRWSDIDLEERLVHVRHNVQRLPEVGLVYGSPKTGRARRTVPLPSRSVKVLRAHRASRAAEARALGPQWPETGLVSPRRSGR
jgi:integrase